MRVTSVRLTNFKRFTDLSIRDIPPTSRLVVVVGPNGAGKSSLFDALLTWYRIKTGFGAYGDNIYFRKNEADTFDWSGNVVVTTAGQEEPRRGSLYVRSAYRNDPDFAVQNLQRPNSPSEEIKLNRTIENDQTVSENYRRLIYDTVSGVYATSNDGKTVATLREELIGEVRSSMRRVFGSLLLNNISDPLGQGSFYFEKGLAKNYHYKNLSGGEKAAFDLILDLHVKKKFFSDAVYCIDEIETHLHTKVQGTLLKELMKIVPESGQLWVTTHSLGVMRAAQELELSHPGTVCVIDFDIDPDIPQIIAPSNLGRVTWDKFLSIALDDYSSRVTPSKVIICEGSSVGSRRKDFDAEIYNRVFSPFVPDVQFVSGGSSSQVAATGISIRDTLSKIVPAATVVALADRDDKSQVEVAQFEANLGIVLGQRNIESYLFSDEVLTALAVQEGKPDEAPNLIAAKAVAVANSVARGNPADDMKSAAGETYIAIKRILGLQRCGNNVDAFMRDTLAQLIRPPMQIYALLKAHTVDRL